MKSMFPLEKIEDIKKRPQDYRLLYQVPLTREEVSANLPLNINITCPNECVSSIVFLDTETTGMFDDDIDGHPSKIIELVMVRCTFSLDRKIILSVDSIYSGYEDPQYPIPENITNLTGISNDMVRGKRFVDQEVQSFLVDAPLMVAHNAKFDRPFFDRRFPQLSYLPWACTIQGIDWHALGIDVVKLEYLVKNDGFFYDTHRAYDDGLALCHLMIHQPQAMAMLIDSAMRLVYKIEAVDAPYSVKDTLKQNGYKWNSTDKVWYIQVSSTDVAVYHVNFLKSLYDHTFTKIRISSYSAQEMFRL